MEVMRQQEAVESSVGSVGGQKAPMSNPRKVLVGVMVLTAIYVVWGIAKVIS